MTDINFDSDFWATGSGSSGTYTMSGNVNVTGGSVPGGKTINTNGKVLTINSGVTFLINGQIFMNASSGTSEKVTNNGTITISGSSAQIRNDGYGTVENFSTINISQYGKIANNYDGKFENKNTGTINIENNAKLYNEENCIFNNKGTINIDSTSQIINYAAFDSISESKIVNQGKIYNISSNAEFKYSGSDHLMLDSGSKIFNMSSATFTMGGTIQTNYGEITNSATFLLNRFTNNGTFTNNSLVGNDTIGLVLVNNSTWTSGSSAIINLNYDNNGNATILSNSAIGGTINNGTVYQPNGSGLIEITSNLSVSGNYEFNIKSGQTLQINNGVTFTNSGTLVNDGTITNNNVITNTNGAILSSSAISGTAPSGGTYYKPDSNGLIEIQADFTLLSAFTVKSGQTLQINNGVTFTNSGTLTNNGNVLRNGTLTNTNGTITNTNGAILSNNTTAIDGTVTGGANYQPDSNGVIKITSDFTLSSGTEFNIKSGQTLQIDDSVTFTNNGTLTNNDTIIINQTLVNNNSITNTGNILSNSVINNSSGTASPPTAPSSSGMAGPGPGSEESSSSYYYPINDVITITAAFTLSTGSEFIVKNGQVLQINSSVTFTNNGTLTNKGTVVSSGEFTNVNGTVTNTDGTILSNSATGGTVSGGANYQPDAGHVIQLTENFTLPNGTTFDILPWHTLTINGTHTFINSGTLNNDGIISTYKGTLSNGAPPFIGTITNYNTIYIATSATLTNGAGSTINNKGVITDHGTLTNNGTMTNN